MSHQRIQAQRGQIKPLSAKATLEGVNDDICGFFFSHQKLITERVVKSRDLRSWRPFSSQISQTRILPKLIKKKSPVMHYVIIMHSDAMRLFLKTNFIYLVKLNLQRNSNNSNSKGKHVFPLSRRSFPYLRISFQFPHNISFFFFLSISNKNFR